MTMKAVHFAICGVVALVCAACAVTPQPRPPAAAAGMVAVPRGRFTMGWDDGQLNERPEHRVRLADFAIDRCEVSAQEFAEFLNDRGNPDERYFLPGEHATVVLLAGGDGPGRGAYAPRPGHENLPANNVSWFGADAYCRWKGKRLPTEAEWEKAARGGDERLFPWGPRPPDPSTARYDQLWDQGAFEVFVPVDALPAGASAYGALNMSGNVLEWVGDWYRQNLCDFCSPEREANLPLIRRLTGEAAGDSAESAERQAPPREDPTGPSTGSFKVLRGGSWQDRASDELSATHRFWLDPSQRFPHTGFRCAHGPS